MSPDRRRSIKIRPGFTLVEMMVAGVIAALLLGVVSGSIAQLGRAKNSTQRRHTAFLRADTALSQLRRDIASVTRSTDLFYTRFVIYGSAFRTPLGVESRDELLIFNTRLRTVRDQDYVGEGLEYETQYRILDDEFGSSLWRRRDAFPDEYPFGGGVATPLVSGVIGLFIEAYNGDEWINDWDSDYDGLPLAVRVTVTASGHRLHEDPYGDSIPHATLRTVIAIDRVPLPDMSDLSTDSTTPDNPDADPEGNVDGGDPGAPNIPGGPIPGIPTIPGGGGRPGAPIRPGAPVNPGGNRPTPAQTPGQTPGGFGTTLDGGPT